MNQPSSIQESVAIILAHPAPILALDACSILDVVRSQYRLEAPSRLLSIALMALAANSGQQVQLHRVVFGQVCDEVQRNLLGEQQRLKQHMLTLRNTGSAVLSSAELNGWNQAIQSIEDTLARFPTDWIDGSLLVASDPTCTSRAQARLAGNIAPAKRGSNNVGDCLIVEHLLELARSLKAGGFTQSIYFISSNTRDFGQTSLKTPLDSEFQVEGIEYLPHIEAAMLQLGF